MESKQHIPSVIAKLMGLDELSPRPDVKRQRVLSEKYLQRVASLGVQDTFRSRKYPSRKHSDGVKEHESVGAAGKLERGKLYNMWDQKGEAYLGSTGLKSVDSRRYSQKESVVSSRKSDIVSEFPISYGHLSQKLDGESNVGNHASSHPQAMKNIVNSRNLSYSSSSNMYRNNGEKSEKVKIPRFSKHGLHLKELAHTSHIPDAGWKDKYFGMPRFRPFTGHPTTCQGHRRGRNIGLNSSKYKQLEYHVRNVLPGSEMQDGSQKICLDRSRQLRSADKQSWSFASFDTKKYHSSIGNYLILDGQRKTDQQGDTCQKGLVASVMLNKSSFFIKDDDYSSQSADDSFLQDTSNVYFEDGTGLSRYSGSDRESLTSLDGYQPSPDSVLESYFKDDRAAPAECLWGVSADPHGLKMHLDLLRSRPSEAYSEGSEVNVSSDDDNGEESICGSQESRDIMRFFRAEESRDFSYLVEVLTGASFLERKLDQIYKEWHMPDCPISLQVFEALEKKYGEQTHWKRSDRRLLFDRINLCLLEFFMPCMGVPTWTKPVSKRLAGQCKEAIEDELWTLLVKQEREAHDALSNKIAAEFGKCLNLGDYAEMIVLELEAHILDELAAEVVSLGRF